MKEQTIKKLLEFGQRFLTVAEQLRIVSTVDRHQDVDHEINYLAERNLFQEVMLEVERFLNRPASEDISGHKTTWCPYCEANKQVFYNEPGGMKEHASWWHLPKPGADLVECPNWRDYEIEKLTKDVEMLQNHLSRFKTKKEIQ